MHHRSLPTRKSKNRNIGRIDYNGRDMYNQASASKVVNTCLVQGSITDLGFTHLSLNHFRQNSGHCIKEKSFNLPNNKN